MRLLAKAMAGAKSGEMTKDDVSRLARDPVVVKVAGPPRRTA
jgi:hypothetical protein